MIRSTLCRERTDRNKKHRIVLIERERERVKRRKENSKIIRDHGRKLKRRNIKKPQITE